MLYKIIKLTSDSLISTKRSRHKSRPNFQRGQALVEGALVLPLFFLLMFGIIDFSRAYYYQSTLSSEARTAVRNITLPTEQTSDCDALNSVISNANGIKISQDPLSHYGNQDPRGNPGNATTTPSQGTGLAYVWPAVSQAGVCQGTTGIVRPSGPVSVVITYSFTPITPIVPLVRTFIPSFFPNNQITIRVTSELQTEY